MQEWGARLFGISLDLPLTRLSGSEPFTPPLQSRDAEHDGPTPFLWQAPNSNAVLYAGTKWIELHAFVSRLLEFQHKTQPLPAFFSEKVVSKIYPSWLEHAVKLSRARGYWTLYPSDVTASNLAVVHNERFRAPEEYEKEVARDAAATTELTLSKLPLLESLPFGGNLPPFNEMPMLLWDGKPTTFKNLDSAAAEYTQEFRRAVGGCEGLTPSELALQKTMKDLFCSKED